MSDDDMVGNPRAILKIKVRNTMIYGYLLGVQVLSRLTSLLPCVAMSSRRGPNRRDHYVTTQLNLGDISTLLTYLFSYLLTLLAYGPADATVSRNFIISCLI